jgi:hypothetical protein
MNSVTKFDCRNPKSTPSAGTKWNPPRPSAAGAVVKRWSPIVLGTRALFSAVEACFGLRFRSKSFETKGGSLVVDNCWLIGDNFPVECCTRLRFNPSPGHRPSNGPVSGPETAVKSPDFYPC